MKPYTLFIILILRLLSALPFAVYYSSLQLYLLNAHFNSQLATSLVGSVLALSFGSALIGGMLAGRYISFYAFFIFCMICQALGCLTFITVNQNAILWFCTLFLIGSSGITISINMIITQYYKAEDNAREKSFFWLYMALNLGYLIGYSLAGYSENLDSYYDLSILIFSLSAIGIGIAIYYKKIIHKKNNFHLLKFTAITIASFFCIRFLLQFSEETNIIILLAWLIIAFSMLFILTQKHPHQKNQIAIFYVLLVSALIFWSAYFLAPMALIIFIKNNVNLEVFSLSVAPQWIQNINTLMIIGGTILLGLKKPKTLNTRLVVRQFSIGLLCMSIGFALLAFGIFFTTESDKIMLIWVVLSYILQSAGELLIGPIGFSLIGRFIPESYHNIMMGIWVTMLGVAGVISSKLSELTPYNKENALVSMVGYKHFFIVICLATVVTAIIIFWISQKFVKPQPLH